MQQLRQLRAQQRSHSAARHEHSYQTMRANMVKRHKQERGVMQQKLEDARLKLLKQRRQGAELSMRQRHNASCKLAHVSRKQTPHSVCGRSFLLCGVAFTLPLCL